MPERAPATQLGTGTWVVMGSSSAAGAGAPRGKSWVALMAAAFAPQGVEVVNLARPGAVTYLGVSSNRPRVARRPLPDRKSNIDAALAHSPALLIVSYPTNDTTLHYSVEETVNNLMSMRAQAQAAGVPVIVLSTQPRKLDLEQLAQLREIDRRVAASVGPCFVDVYQLLAGDDGTLAQQYDWGDGIHPGKAGHFLIAGRVVGLIRSGECIRLVKH